MKRVSISFYDEIYDQLEQRMKNNGAKSVAHCVRELVELGLRVEAAAQNSNGKSDENDVKAAVIALNNFLKTNLAWSLETRLLTRFLVENHPGDNSEKRLEVLAKYKASANNYVNGLYGEIVE